MLKKCIQRFTGDRNYAIAWTLLGAVLVSGFLSVFLITKIVSEVRIWSENGQEYATNTISVQAEGEVIAVPDIATFSFGVNITSESVESAQEESAKVMNLAIAYLTDNGIEEKDIKTTNYYVSPKYEYNYCIGINCPPQESQLVGYEVNQSVEVKVRETNKAGEILSGIGAQGVTNVSGLNFTIDDETALQDEARSKAVKEARKKAEQLAEDLGVKLKKVVSFSEDNNYGGGPEYAIRAMDGAVKSSVSVAPQLPIGENIIISNVYITYEIR